MEARNLSISQLNRPDVASIGEDLRLIHVVKLWNLFSEPVQLDAYAIFVCMHGDIDLSINQQRYKLGADMLAVNFPENVLCVHEHRNVEAYAVLMSQKCFDSLNIDLNQFARIYAHFKSHVVFPLPREEMVELYHYFSLLRHNALRRLPGFMEIIRGLLRTGIFQLFSIIKSSSDIRLEAMEGKPSRSSQIFTDFLTCLSAHCMSERSVRFYADNLCLTPGHLTTVIKEYSGRTISEWVNEYVIMEAKRLLHSSGLSVQEISGALSFPSQSAFGKYFKQYTGLSPRDFRKHGLD